LAEALLGTEAIGALATSEPSAGSDVSNIQTQAVEANGGFVLSGEKHYVTNAPFATHFIVTARTRADMGARGITAFIIPRQTPGLSVKPETPKAGMGLASMAGLTLNECRLEHASILGALHGGDAVLRLAMAWERALILAPQVGAMSAQLEQTVLFASSRTQSGRPIGRYQGVSHRVANMAIRLEAARLMLYQAAERVGTDRDGLRWSSMAKVFISEAAIDFHMDALKVHGAAGYVDDSDVARGLQDSLGGLFHSGTSEIQRNIIASLLGL
jgi:alkylation response protein AidB-like acyl-CoA dehydrogenase